MSTYQYRHHFRLDQTTEFALEQICLLTLTPKATLMRRYVQEGVARDARRYAEEIENVAKATAILTRSD